MRCRSTSTGLADPPVSHVRVADRSPVPSTTDVVVVDEVLVDEVVVVLGMDVVVATDVVELVVAVGVVCRNVTVVPAMSNEPVRAAPVTFGSTVNVKAPLPVPVAF